MDNLKTDLLQSNLLRHKTIVVALSGGLDSVVLFHYLRMHYSDVKLRAVHINHHLHRHSDKWADFCQILCTSNHVKYICIDIFPSKKNNIEKNARDMRYQVLLSHLKKNEVLCTAHHAQDQAETLLLQLFRGSGIAGLSSMPMLKKFGKNLYYRPFLSLEKIEISRYAKEHQLKFIEDESNFNTYFRRNFIRHTLLPLIKTRYNGIIKCLTRTAKHQGETFSLLQDLAKQDIKYFKLVSANGRFIIDALNHLPKARIGNILRYYFCEQHILMPCEKILKQIINTLLTAKLDARPLVKWSYYEARRYQNELYILNTNMSLNHQSCLFRTRFENKKGFEVRYRVYGQRCRLPNQKHSKPLKKILQERHIPPWERDKLAMYYVDGKLKAMQKIGMLSTNCLALEKN